MNMAYFGALITSTRCIQWNRIDVLRDEVFKLTERNLMVDRGSLIVVTALEGKVKRRTQTSGKTPPDLPRITRITVGISC